jgi:hypothetical protein
MKCALTGRFESEPPSRRAAGKIATQQGHFASIRAAYPAEYRRKSPKHLFHSVSHEMRALADILLRLYLALPEGRASARKSGAACGCSRNRLLTQPVPNVRAPAPGSAVTVLRRT